MKKETKTLQLENIKIFKHNQGTIAVTGPDGFLGQVSNDPKSKNHNEILYRSFKEMLVAADKWQDEE